MQRVGDGFFVAAARLDHDLDFRPAFGLGLTHETHELAVAFGVIVQSVAGAQETELQRRLGNVEACIDSGDSVLTHTCKCEPPQLVQTTRGAHSTVRVWSNGCRCRALHNASPSRACRVRTRPSTSPPRGLQNRAAASFTPSGRNRAKRTYKCGGVAEGSGLLCFLHSFSGGGVQIEELRKNRRGGGGE